ncbi:NDR1/HIN1-like protein 3 [Rutidosis leptorrhynchoides]|uniref:NDR1/HIN1-like protein 3 n=1 Tax=Rutidosis leptorrhynchoides TaxID=125765 RepID=UPI003A997ADC
MTSLIREQEKIVIVCDHPVLQNINSDQSSESESSYIRLCIEDKFILCLILFVIFVLTFGVITTSTIPRVEVDDVTLTRFILSPTNNTLYFCVAAKITFRNPYSIVGIQFDKIDVNLMYQNERLGTKEMSDVFLLLANQEKSFVNVVLRGERVLQLNHGDEKLVYESEIKSGVFKIGVKVRTVIRARAMLVTEQNAYEYMFDNLEVPLSSIDEEVSSAI